MPAAQPHPGRADDPYGGVGPGPFAQADQAGVLLPEPGPEPLSLVLGDPGGGMDRDDRGRLQQTRRHAQPVLTGTRHDDGPVQIESVRRRRGQAEVGHPDHGGPFPGVGGPGHQGHGQAQALHRVRAAGLQLEHPSQTRQRVQSAGYRGALHPQHTLPELMNAMAIRGGWRHLPIIEHAFDIGQVNVNTSLNTVAT
jgi:hypothetical protein